MNYDKLNRGQVFASDEATATAEPKAPEAPPAVKQNQGNGADGESTSAPAKPRKAKRAAPKAKKAKAKTKKAAPKAKKAKAKRAARTVDPAKLDEFGLRKSSLKSKAAALYAAKGGATLAEVSDKLKSTQFNVLTQLEAQGFKLKREQEDGDGNRKVTRYFLIRKK